MTIPVPVPDIKWTPYLKLKLEAYTMLGLSGSQIAEEFSCSRSAICGICARQKIRLRGGYGRSIRRR